MVNPKDLLLEDLPKSEYNSTNCELAVYRRECDNAILIFVANTSEKSQEASIDFRGRRKFTDMQSHANKTVTDCLNVTLRPFEIQIWKVKKEEH